MSEGKRILGVDYGEVRVGLAITDADGLIATPLEVIDRRGAEDRIAKTAEDRGVREVVVGLPLHMSGAEGPSAEAARVLAAGLEARGLRVALVDERMTTLSAERVLIESGHSRKKRKRYTDAVAAAILLEAYLARQRSQAADPEAGS